MAMGREGEVQGDLMISWGEMPRSPGHVFYDRLQKLLAEAGFDAFVEEVSGTHPRGHVWTAPVGQGFPFGCANISGAVMSTACLRGRNSRWP